MTEKYQMAEEQRDIAEVKRKLRLDASPTGIEMDGRKAVFRYPKPMEKDDE